MTNNTDPVRALIDEMTEYLNQVVDPELDVIEQWRDRLEAAIASAPPSAPAIGLRFGLGKLVVNTGTHDGEPAVIVDLAPEPGQVGAKAPDVAPETLAPLRMLFPTAEQAERVADALVNTPPSAPVGVECLARSVANWVIAALGDLTADYSAMTTEDVERALLANTDHAPHLAQQPAAPSGEAVAWLRMKPDGTPDWAEDCIGSDDKFLDPEMASDGYYLQPLYTTPQQPAAGEEIMVNAAHDVFTLPLQPSGLSSGPRFVVHVPEQPATSAEHATCNLQLATQEPVAWAFFTEKGEVAFTGIYDRTLKALEMVKTTRMGISAGSIDLYAAPVAAQVPKHLLYRLRKHADDDRNSAFARSAMREALQYLEAAQTPGRRW